MEPANWLCHGHDRTWLGSKCMDPRDYFVQQQTRRTFFKNTGLAAGRLGLASLMFPGLFRAAAGTTKATHAHPGLPGLPHFPPKARRLIYLFMNGAPSQIDLWDYKPRLSELFDTDLPESIRNGQRLTTMTSGQKRFPIAPTIYKFAPHGKCGTMVSELLPHTAQVVDDLAVIRSVYTEAINHDPASTYILTGNQVPGKPSIGAWLSYGLGSEAENLPVASDRFDCATIGFALRHFLDPVGTVLTPATNDGKIKKPTPPPSIAKDRLPPLAMHAPPRRPESAARKSIVGRHAHRAPTLPRSHRAEAGRKSAARRRR